MINKQLLNNRFEVIRPIGEGGFGQVLLVFDHEVKEICALKIIRDELLENPTIIEEFKKEITVWLEFEKHPNIVNARSTDFFNGKLYLALEFIAPNELGVNTLDEIIIRKSIPLIDSMRWGIEICNGMKYALNKGLIAHRDLKPSNLMIDVNNTLKITDFGLAIFSIDPFNKFIDRLPSGTPIYMPPEQFLQNVSIDHRSDIYSFGIILFEMISGELPFSIRHVDPLNYFEQMFRLHSTYKIAKLENPLFPVIERCLEKQPENRFQTFQEVYEELQKIHLSITGEKYKQLSQEKMDASEHNNYAVSYDFIGEPQKALFHIEESLKALPNFPLALNNKASILIKLGQVQKAFEIWNKLTQIAPELGRPFYNIGNIFMQKGDTPLAIKHFKKALDREPDYIPAIVNLAICYQQFDVKSSIKYYNLALEISPNDSQIIYNKAFLLHNNGFHSEAIKLFNRVIQLNPNHVSSFNYLGLCYEAMNEFDKALACYERALEIEPKYPYVIQNKQKLIERKK